MRVEFERRVLSIVMDIIHEAGFQDVDCFAEMIAHSYCQLVEVGKGKVAKTSFLAAVRALKTPFFRVNAVDRQTVNDLLYPRLSKIDVNYHEPSGFEIANNFVSGYIEIGYDKSKFAKEREQIVSRFERIYSPHDKLLSAFDVLLQRIAKSFQLSLHGIKEYSGIDVSKKISGAIIGFQIKTLNDDISEDKIRSQTSKALEYNIDGFVWIYGRALSRAVQTSIQAAHHHFVRINERKKTYCSLIPGETLAELFRIHAITF
ncbi:MAG: hypothetical protein WED05_08950 [Candidatus Atabeyarchaeum deiterrae]